MAQRGTITIVMYVIEIIVIALLGVLLAGGFATIALTGGSASPANMTGFNSGLSMILMAFVLGVGAGALHFHRQEIQDHSRILENQARIGREIGALRTDMRALMYAQAERNEKLGDQLSERRQSKN